MANNHSIADSGFDYRTDQSVGHGRGHWLPIVILTLEIYPTIFSAIWLIVAITKPRYGQRISATSNLPLFTVSLLCAPFAESIELSFVHCLYYLSRRSS